VKPPSPAPSPTPNPGERSASVQRESA
jgi:hypothetical protein